MDCVVHDTQTGVHRIIVNFEASKKLESAYSIMIEWRDRRPFTMFMYHDFNDFMKHHENLEHSLATWQKNPKIHT